MRIDNVIDVNQKVNAIASDMELPLKMKDFNPIVPHDHTPVSDVRGIVECYIYYLKQISVIKTLRKR